MEDPEETLRILSEELNRAFQQFHDWEKTLPNESLCYLNHEFIRRQRPAEYSHEEFVVAGSLFDIHSLYCSIYILKSWRLSELVDQLVWSIKEWNVTCAALATRALIETACSWEFDSRDLVDAWQTTKASDLKGEKDFTEMRNHLISACIQPAIATKLSSILKDKESSRIQRKNIQTFIQKYEKQFCDKNLFRDYELLCDCVHPSWGANRCYWQETGFNDSLKQMRIVLKRKVLIQGKPDKEMPEENEPRITEVIHKRSTQTIIKIIDDLKHFLTVCNDMCLTAKIYMFQELNYFGIVRPSGKYDLCSCGSGKKTKFCPHQFKIETRGTVIRS